MALPRNKMGWMSRGVVANKANDAGSKLARNLEDFDFKVMAIHVIPLFKRFLNFFFLP